jgi:hypothetical protein
MTTTDPTQPGFTENGNGQEIELVTNSGTTDPNALGPVTNDGAADIAMMVPYTVHLRILGTATILFHRWSNEAVAEKAAAKKGSTAKKTDNVESYVYRDQAGNICLPGRYLIGSMTDPRNGAAKYRQDPRSTRKSALDLYKAGVVALTELAPVIPVGQKDPTPAWDFLDQQRVMVQRQGITRTRPAFHPGWSAGVDLMVLSPEYITPADLLACLTMAGQLVGVADFRPTYGRFAITNWDIGFPGNPAELLGIGA